MKEFFFSISPLVTFIVSGESMKPQFNPSEKILVQKRWFFCKLSPQDIVVLQSPKTTILILKRIIKIRGNEFYVVGDNKKESTDSRKFGWVCKKNIVGKVVYPKSR